LASGKGLWAVVAVAIVIVVAIAVILLSSSDETSSASATTTENAADSVQVYEFEIRSKIPQKIKITDRYGDSDDVRSVVIDATVPANRPQILRGRGTLEIRDEVGGNLEIRFPSVNALRSATAGKIVGFEASEKSATLSSSSNYWVADPLAASVAN